jgi:dihydroorotase
VTTVSQATAQLIRQVRVVDAVSRTDQVMDVWVEGGIIQAMAPSLDSPTPERQGIDLEVIDGRGQVLLPGLVDLYSQSGEPGHEPLETLASLLAAGQTGGFSRLGLLPTTSPAIDNLALVEQQLEGRRRLAPSLSLPQIYPWAALTLGTQGQQMTELAELATGPIVGFTDGRPLNNPILVQRLLEYAAPLGKPVALWPCDRALQSTGVAREGAFSLVYGLPGDPVSSETAALAALLEVVAVVGTPVHIMRLSTARGVELVQQAKGRGLPVTASTSWMHLLFSTQDLHSYDPNLRLAPPLGNPGDQAALVAGVKGGSIDAIAIDHTPHSYEDKTVGFPSAPPGVIGLELAWPLLWQRLVALGDWSPLTLVQALSTHPANLWGQSPPTLQAQQPAEMALFDPTLAWTVTPDSLQSLSANTPWLGQTIQGRITRTWVPQDVPLH